MKKGELTTDQYLAAVSQKVDEVRDAGITIEDKELSLFAMDDLDSSYDAFVTIVTATKGDISFAEFKGLLQSFEARTLRESHLPPFANFLQANSQGSKPYLPPPVNYSQPPPQATTSYKNASQQQQAPESNYSTILCQIYQKRGHTALVMLQQA